VVFAVVPLLPLPDWSVIVVPDPVSNPYAATSPAGAAAASRDGASETNRARTAISSSALVARQPPAVRSATDPPSTLPPIRMASASDLHPSGRSATHHLGAEAPGPRRSRRPHAKTREVLGGWQPPDGQVDAAIRLRPAVAGEIRLGLEREELGVQA